MPSGESVPRSVLDHLLEGFQIVSRDFVYLYVNPAAATQGRSTPEQLEGRSMFELYPGIEHSPLVAQMTRAMTDQVATSIENHFTYPDGTQRWFELRIEPVPQGVCVHSIDIDDRKRAEAGLRALNEQLESRVAQRTAQLERSNRDLEAFCYSVSHDLRAPLRAVDGFAAMLVERAGAVLDEESREYLARIQAAGTRMGRLIEELLRLAKLGTADLIRREIDVSAIAQSVADDLNHGAPERQVTWVIAPGIRAMCDGPLVRIALENVLGNAFKFTAKTPDARIEVASSADDPSAIVVTDNGAGFDMKSSGSLFRPFRRLHAERDFPGLGIGLATVQRIVEKHGGSVVAYGVVGQGARLTLRFEH